MDDEGGDIVGGLNVGGGVRCVSEGLGGDGGVTGVGCGGADVVRIPAGLGVPGGAGFGAWGSGKDGGRGGLLAGGGAPEG